MSQTKAQLLDNIKDNVQLDARNSLRFADTDSSHYVAFKAPATVSSNVTWTLPAADGSANYVLATDGSGTLSWIADPAGQWVTSSSNIYFTGGNVGIGDNSPSNPLSVTGASAFNGDVQFTGAAANVTWDKSADDLIFNDNAKAAFGTGSDLQIYYTGSSGWVYQSESGNDVSLGANGGNVWLRTGASANDDAIKCVNDGGVELYYDNVKKFETQSAGVELTGKLTFATEGLAGGSIDLGIDADLNLYHDNSDAYFDNNVGDFYIRNDGSSTSEKIRIQAKGGEQSIVASPNGAVELYYDNSKKFETTSAGALVTGTGTNSVQILGTGSYNLYSYHDSGGVGWATGAGGSYGELLYLDESGSTARLYAAGELGLNVIGNGAVELYFDNSKKFETTSYGNASAGQLRVTSSNATTPAFSCGDSGTGFYNTGTNSIGYSVNGAQKWAVSNAGHLTVLDSVKFQCGNAGDLQIYHNGTHNYIDSTNGKIHIRHGTDNAIQTIADGAVELYYDNSKKLETNSTGIHIFGNTGHADGAADLYGSSNDLSIYHDGTNSYITNATGVLLIRAKTDENSINCNPDGAVELYHNNTKRIYTSSTGGTISGTGNLYADFCTATNGHFITAQSDENTHAVEIYQQHGSNTNRYSLVINDNRTGSKSACFYVRGDGETFSHPNDLSDRALKDNITDMASSYTKVKNLRPVNFNWKGRVDTEGNPVVKSISGFIAQEVEEQIPNLINGEEGNKGINSAGLVAHVTKALQEAITKIETLETKVAALEAN